MNIKHLFFPLIFFLSFIKFGFCQEKPQNSGFLDFNGYYDTREFSVLTINILANLNHRFQYFSLTNYQGNQSTSDLSGFYAEHNLRWCIKESAPLDATYQYVMREGDHNDDHRLGLRWRLNNTSFLESLFSKLNLKYSFNPMFIQLREKTDINWMTMIEHVYQINLFPKKLGNRLYLAGFADQNFIDKNGKLSTEWVTEHQLGFELKNNFYAVIEYRINTYLPVDKVGLGYGVEYKVVF